MQVTCPHHVQPETADTEPAARQSGARARTQPPRVPQPLWNGLILRGRLSRWPAAIYSLVYSPPSTMSTVKTRSAVSIPSLSQGNVPVSVV